MILGKCRKCGKETDNFIEFDEWYKAHFPDRGEGYWKCKECIAYDAALAVWENEQYGTSEIVCPWCGYEHSDSWECADSDDEFECAECGKPFSYTREVEVTYTSKRRECDFGFEAVER